MSSTAQMNELDEIQIDVSEDDTFDQTEAPRVVSEYVCAVCHGDLTIVFAKAHWRVLVVCPEHGNVTRCGRVTRNTVSIENERAYSKFNSVIHALPDLWGELIEKRLPPREGEDREQQNLRELGY